MRAKMSQQKWQEGEARRKKRYNLAHIEKIRAYAKQYRAKKRKERIAYEKTYKQANLEKFKARYLLHSVVRRDKNFRPGECSRCHVKCVPHGHHADYSKPLEVKWLCPTCHLLEHGRTPLEIMAKNGTPTVKHGKRIILVG